MRERTTWNRDAIKTAATSKTADPYQMNQDHLSKQPPADKYVTGDPSTFGEDIHPSTKTWEAEYANGQVKRNEIGQPEMRGDTFNHPEKTASAEVLLKKANLTIRVASMMLGKNASEQAIEDQSVALMHLPDAELVNTFNRLAGDAPMEQTAEMQQQSAYQTASEQCKQALLAGDQAGVDRAMQAMMQAQQAQQQQQAPVAQQQQQVPVAQQIEQRVQAAVKTALQNVAPVAQVQAPVAQQQQAPVAQEPPMQQQAQPMQQQAPVAEQMPMMGDDATLDELLMDDSPGMSEMEIEMDAPSMDTGDTVFGPEDAVLTSLFASDETEEQQSQEEQTQQKQAGVRTASTRTVGTRPSGGVARVGGGASAGRSTNDTDRLSSMWATAPDVKSAFNM